MKLIITRRIDKMENEDEIIEKLKRITAERKAKSESMLIQRESSDLKDADATIEFRMNEIKTRMKEIENRLERNLNTRDIDIIIKDINIIGSHLGAGNRLINDAKDMIKSHSQTINVIKRDDGFDAAINENMRVISILDAVLSHLIVVQENIKERMKQLEEKIK